MVLFKPSYSNKISEVNTGIGCGPLFNTSGLIGIQEAISYYIELELIADDFLDEFTSSVE